MSHFLSNRTLRWCLVAASSISFHMAGGGALLGQNRLLPPGRFYPADGVVYFDQNRALAGNVTPGDAAGFPVTISQSGSYRLTGNLTVPDLNTTAVQITADFVTLDLNGFSIIGPAICTTGTVTACPAAGTGIGVRATGDQTPFSRGIRVRNGSVRGMGLFGIVLNGSGSFVEKVTVDSNAGGGMVVAGVVSESAATQNGSFGILAATVRNSTALQNHGDGIIVNVNGGVAAENVSSLNEGPGITVQFGTATANTLFLNQAVGISALCPSTIVGNTVVSNGPASIETTGDGCALANNGMRQ